MSARQSPPNALEASVKHSRALAVVLLTLPLASCQTLLAILSAGFQRPVVTFREASLQGITLDEATVAATFDVQNPNAIGVETVGIAYAFSLDGKQILEGQLPAGLQLGPNAVSPLVLPVRIPFSAVPDLVNLVATKSEAPYGVRATVSIRTPVQDFAIPLSWEGVLPIPRLPTVRVASAALSELSLGGARLTVTLGVENPNAFAIPFDALEGDIQVAGQSLAKLGLERTTALGARGSTELAIPVQISFLAAGLAVSTALAAQSADLAVRGAATFAGRKVPLNLSTTVH